ncbi:hypothetical protein EP7_001700 [Isosphaeraceae bacterium EP7]
MVGLFDRLTFGDTGPTVGETNRPTRDVLERIEAGETPSTLGLPVLDVIAALAFEALGGEKSLGLPLIKGEPRRPAIAKALSEPALAAWLPNAARPARLALSAGLLQIFEEWSASHEAAQEADDLGEDKVAGYWHAIAHRREPDAGNATYWFRRIGRHPVFGAMERTIATWPTDEPNPAPVDRLVKGGEWDPLGFINWCDQARPGSPTLSVGRRLQRAEMIWLLEYTAEVAGVR